MIPFGNDLYFYILILFLIPAIVLGLMGKKLKYYGFFVTLLFVPIVYSTFAHFKALAFFFCFSLVCVFIYSKLGALKKNKILFASFMFLMLVPLLLSKGLFGLKGFSFLGVSYLTFRSLQLIQELKTEKVKRFDLFTFSYFILFFPSISSGPIDRFSRFAKDIEKPLSKAEYFEQLREGVWKLMNGLLYSFAIAPAINSLFMSKIDTSSGVISMVLYMYAYTFYLFFNFAGYSKLAIGTAYIIGVKMPENFNLPFASVDLKDFWTRWHISLSTFFRDYIYTRFVGGALKGKWFKSASTASYFGYILTMFTMGVWHGFQAHYLLYGLYHGVLMCLNDWLDNHVKSFKKFKKSHFGSIVCAIVTFNLIAFGLLLFSGKLI